MAGLIDTIIAELKKSAETSFIHTPTYHHIRGDKYYSSYIENLFCGSLSEFHKSSFGEAQGGELLPKGDRPAKMSAIRSSSALAVNIFGNDSHVQIIDNQIDLPNGKFDLKYEEAEGQTIIQDANDEKNPHYANIDVRLTNADEAEIFIEVKMLEPLSFTPKLNEAYANPNNYNPMLGSKLIDAFVKIFERYNAWAKDKSNKKNPAHCFDACQMFKHLLAILDLSMKGKLKSKNVILVNCHWNFEAFPKSKIQSKRVLKTFERKCDQYKASKKEYCENIELLKKLILDAGILDNLTIVNCSHTEIIDGLDITPKHRKYLERYSITQ